MNKKVASKNYKKLIVNCCTICFLLLFQSCETVEREFYQLSIYSLENEQQEKRLDDYLQNSFIPALNQNGIEHVGVFKKINKGEIEEKNIYIFIPFNSILQFEELERKLQLDNEYLNSGKDYIEASYDNPPYNRIKTILLRAFKSFPKYGIPNHNSKPSERIYELRSYQAATEKLYRKKVEMFDDGGESKIFVDLGFQPIFFGEVLAGNEMPNLMYLTTFENDSSHTANWNSFRTSPDWEILKKDNQYANTVSKNDKYYLYPTDYSQL